MEEIIEEAEEFKIEFYRKRHVTVENNNICFVITKQSMPTCENDCLLTLEQGKESR